MNLSREHHQRARRRQAPYAVMFAAAIVLLLTGAVSTFRVIGASALRAIAADSVAAANTTWPGDSTDVSPPIAPVAPRRAEYDRFAAEDRAWRDEHARAMTMAELRARGDGRRTPREAMQDRVFRYQRAGRRARAIDELEKWVHDQPRDQEAVLSLARLLREAGRTDDALRRYREVLALSSALAGR